MFIRGTDISIPLQYVRVQPYVSAKIQLSSGRTERVDLRVLPVIFRMKRPPGVQLYPGQMVDVYIESSAALWQALVPRHVLAGQPGSGQPLTITIRVTDATITLDDVGEGVPVLLLHGFPATRYLWSRVVPLLATAGFRVLVPDLVGYGASEAAAGVRIDMASQAHWMLEVLDALGVARAVVVAHDVGSAAAQLMVAGAAQRIRALAVLDGVYAAEWAMDAIASIQAWDPAEAHRLYPVLARRIATSGPLREML